jgi:hypothetical protein
VSSFEALVLDWAAAACSEWGYPPVGPDWLTEVTQRLPQGLRAAVADAVERAVIVVVGGHRFTLAGLGTTKGPYAFFSRSSRQVPAPNWEYFVQAAEYGRVSAAVSPRGYRVDFEDDLMDISISDADRLVWCIEVKEKARSLDGLLTGIRGYGRSLDWQAPDRGNDPLRKAKYLARHRPDYFSLVAIGCRFDFSVSYDGDRFSLVDDLVPFA